MSKKAARFTIHGHVQGVGYRVFARTCAESLGLTGWVRNIEDGTVEAHAEGSEEQLAEFAFDLSRGARYARVER
ncbi:MAG: acylphosphatase [Acidobacteria bacterium]|nr:acylphosphatase [Acidobacteriota bacterium]